VRAWTAPGGKIHNQIDHILIACGMSIVDVRSFRGPDCDTDHYLMVEKLGKDC